MRQETRIGKYERKRVVEQQKYSVRRVLVKAFWDATVVKYERQLA